MKKSLFLTLILTLMVGVASAQSSSTNNSTITLSTYIDSLVAPNLITLNIKITTTDGAGRRGIEKAENTLSSTLSNMGIDVQKQLYVKSIGSTYSEKGRDTDLSQIYALTLTESLLAQQVITECQNQNIAVSVEKLDLSNRKEIERQLCKQALLEAKMEAESLASAIGQEVGKANSISRHTSTNYSGNLMRMSSNAASDSIHNSSDLEVIQKIKISATINVSFQLL